MAIAPKTRVFFGFSRFTVSRKPATAAAPHLSRCIPAMMPPALMSAPAGVVGDALADEEERSFGRFRRFVECFVEYEPRQGNSFSIVFVSLMISTLIEESLKSAWTYSATLGAAIRSGSEPPMSRATARPHSIASASW
ncbi:hypothetical protein TYRP_019770 [Tyrophagus putrescentiae]|nr:hypothetical protein TYRP_019770 [Tyrophagus putrescentiae]